MGIIALISNVFGAIKALFGFQSKKLDLRNSPQMQAAQQTRDETAANDRTAKAVEQHDAEEIRKELAE